MDDTRRQPTDNHTVAYVLSMKRNVYKDDDDDDDINSRLVMENSTYDFPVWTVHLLVLSFYPSRWLTLLPA